LGCHFEQERTEMKKKKEKNIDDVVVVVCWNRFNPHIASQHHTQKYIFDP
jgi:hypothetical protein